MAEITYAQAIKDAMSEEMRENPDVVFMGEDIGAYGGAFGVSVGMWEEFGSDRILETPISEAAIGGAAVGAAVTGLRPIAEIMFMDFVTIAMDAIVNQAAKMRYMFGGMAKVPMVLRCPAGSGTGSAAQHSQSLEAWFCHVPGLKVVTPSTPADAKGLLKAAIRDDNPVIFIEQKLLYRTKGDVPSGDYVVEIGKANVVNQGTDLTIVTYGRMLHLVLEAVEKVKDASIEVIDLRSLLPLDKDCIIDSVKKTGRALIVHEAVKTGGLGGELSALITESEAFDYLDAPIVRLAGKDVPVPYNPILEKSVIPSIDEIEEAILKALNKC